MSSLSLGIVGLPNVGKSTLFNALVKNGQALASNYPFCTIDPNVGIVEVPDSRLGVLANMAKPERVMPAVIEFVDIAGIIKGASQGEGLGNAFLANIRETQAILLVARFFEHPDIIHVSGKVDPKSDLEVVLLELILADLTTAQKAVERYRRASKGGDKVSTECLAFAEKLYAVLEAGKPARSVSPTHESDFIVLRELQLLSAKPILILANVSESQIHLSAEEIYKTHGLSSIVNSAEQVIPLCAKLEAELIQLPEDERKDFLDTYEITEPGLEHLIRASYSLLGLQTYFTVGPKEVRAWTIKKKATAPEAAGVIHTDFQKGFIRAEVIAYADYVQAGGEQGAKEAGKLRVEGKEYLVADGDILHFRFSS